MNITAILLIALVAIMFLVIEISEMVLLFNFIRDKDLVMSCTLGLTLIGTCILEILIFGLFFQAVLVTEISGRKL